ncbi:MAG: crossover junction endodeoxyribonuclease RuvC [Lentisphaerae bacterium]|nr:crossover junction endodeoxyribonuclease RuvC [Lentisphaerota bacterium]
MIILGLDPAIRTTGYGVIKMLPGCRAEIIDCGVIRNTRQMPHSECLRRLAGGVRELIKTFAPDCASLESPFVGDNANTAIILGMARGAILTALAENAIPAYAYAPNVAKRAVTGASTARKEQVALMMANEFGIAVSDIPNDATDALALAICHGQKALFSSIDLAGKPL